ncbi:MAG TPA: type II toxin-antitoxin system Phd/YefM family antitoxin [Pyrinomonadaceae bacterium]
MNKIIPVSDLQRQASAILSEVNETQKPVIITQRGRASAVLVSAEQFATMEKELERLEDAEVRFAIAEGLEAFRRGDTISHEEAKRRLGFPA